MATPSYRVPLDTGASRLADLHPVGASHRRVLVPMDFSATARLALKTALGLACTPGDAVLLVYVPGLYRTTAEEKARMFSADSEGFLSVAEAMRLWAQPEAAPGVRVSVVPDMAEPSAAGIAQMAQRTDSSLIVLTKRSYSLLDRLFTGCPCSELPREALCPVCFVDPLAG
jgi:nucleotide-binding universal stress UspA family protein